MSKVVNFKDKVKEYKLHNVGASIPDITKETPVTTIDGYGDLQINRALNKRILERKRPNVGKLEMTPEMQSMVDNLVNIIKKD